MSNRICEILGITNESECLKVIWIRDMYLSVTGSATSMRLRV